MFCNAVFKSAVQTEPSTDPQHSMRLFNNCVDLEPVINFLSKRNVLELPVTGNFTEPVQSISCGCPNCAARVFVKIINNFRSGTTRRRAISLELRILSCCEGIKTRNTIIGCNPVVTCSGYQQIIDDTMRQTIRDAVVGKFIAIEPR